ncbi:hypothetical protein [Ottowia sp.]|uniref:hypothetical protein n=1 Tax=Ottowia sp. TaxID=1898956 RepID=UPI0039E6C900
MLLAGGLLGACVNPPPGQADAGAVCARTVHADVVAIEQAYVLNRHAAFVPAGMLYALRHDVVPVDGSRPLGPGNAMLRPDKRPRPLVLRVNEGDCLQVAFENLLAPDWREESGAPREMNGRLPAHVEANPGEPTSRELVRTSKVSLDQPRTRAASLHVTGLELAPIGAADCPRDAACGGDGSNVGLPGQQGVVFHPSTAEAVKKSFLGSLAKPGQKVVTRWRAGKEGTYFAYSTAAPVGGEGDGGQIGLGLFAAVNVEPQGSRWYRSQVTHEDLQRATRPAPADRHAYLDIDYEARQAVAGGSRPVLNMLDGDRIVHSDVNAIVVVPEGPGAGSDAPACKDKGQHMFGSACGRSFREFTVILHDEIHAQQAFAELEDPNHPLHYLKDGMGINYGASGMGSAVMSTPLQRKVGVAANCPECRGEEFFLSSWANGDPALVLKWDAAGKQPVGARYKDDPSNVHHSYLGDAVRFRNLHAGPKETHVFHLHAHQWVLDASDPDSTYLDSQTISPGATFSYGIEFGGSGNRNYTPGDSIFHCHLYPHFAQGMWELWRVHDVFEDGNDQGLFRPDQPAGPANDPRWRRLPDAEVAGGTENPAVVPIPGEALAPLPSAAFAGYPFYIPGQAGHRPPQPPLDMDVAAAGYDAASGVEPSPVDVVNGGLPRHVVTGGTLKTARDDPAVRAHALSAGGEAAQVIAQRVAAQDPIALNAFAAVWDQIEIKPLPHSGTTAEKSAMRFHEGALAASGLAPREAALTHSDWWPMGKGYATDYAATVGGQQARPEGEALFRVNGRPPAAGAPYANPCPANAPRRHYRGAFIQTELTYNKHGWFDSQGRIVILENDIKDIIDPSTRTRLPEPLFFRANSGDCIDFKSSNFVPSALNADDFQVWTPTDTIGQHIHLVKFDVTSSDGSGNGWNYEDATFSPDEVRERIFANNRRVAATGQGQRLSPKAHPLFRPGGDVHAAGSGGGADPLGYARLLRKGTCPPRHAGETDERYEHRLHADHPFCGAQRTTQLWWADPIINQKGRDNTLRTVFTHDHLGPSSHQQHGLYAGLVIEPANSVWIRVDATVQATDMAQAGAAMAGPGGNLGCDTGAANPSPLCDKLLGGADLAAKVPLDRQRASDPILGVIEPRDPLVLRTDGGPTSTMANIFAPRCVGDSDSSALQPDSGRRTALAPGGECVANEQTRREFALAIADFGIAYNTALEPINPEPRGPDSLMRDRSEIRFGRRHVATLPARPLGISSEDPGSQFVNYRHEPLALRIAEVTPDKSALGGFSYSQSRRRAFSAKDCDPAQGDQDCLGDMANAFSTEVHAARDERLAKQPLRAYASTSTRELLRSLGQEAQLNKVLAKAESWRRDFNCQLYRKDLMAGAGCRDGIVSHEPWREFGDPATPVLPAFEGDPVQIRLVQGSQEAQHIFTMNGLKWHRLPNSLGSGYTHAQPVGISEHFEFDLLVNPAGLPASDHLYFGASVDQLWDGMWGLLRSYRPPSVSSRTSSTIFTSDWASSQQEAVSRGRPVEVWPHGLAPVVAAPPVPQGDLREQVCKLADGKDAPRRFFEITVARACQLAGNCGGAQATGITYNQRQRIRDPDAIVYALHRSERCAAGACDEIEAQASRRTAEQALDELRPRYSGGQAIEPLVMRAAAGECLQVLVRNVLPPLLADGPAAGDPLPERAASNDMLPMITDGFNLNQFRMSSTVGFSVPRLTQNPLYGDGSNTGVNGALALAAGLARSEGARGRQAATSGMQGSLIPPCLPGASGLTLSRCQKSFVLSTLEPGPQRQPIEFGALPVRSFGDVVKHPGHGLMGAVVIGPPGSDVCVDSRFGPSALSAEICVPAQDGQPARRYVDHVLMFQDAVTALHGDLPVGNLSAAEEPDDYGMKAWNYRTEPLWARRGGDPSVEMTDRNEADYSQVFSSAALTGEGGEVRCAAGIAPVLAFANPCDPETPILAARPGERVRLHFVHAGGHTRQQGVALSGHAWNPYPWSADSRRIDASAGSSIRQGVFNGFGPMMGVTVEVTAGGTARVPHDYFMGSQASYLRDGGVWGLLRVEPGRAQR